MDPREWALRREAPAPGRPYGLASVGDGLFAVIALDDDDRFLFRFTPQGGFDPSSKSPCPDLTGSHLAADGSSLYLCQLGKRRILEIDERATSRREIALPARCGGLTFVSPGNCYMIAADEEWENVNLARIDLRQPARAGRARRRHSLRRTRSRVRRRAMVDVSSRRERDRRIQGDGDERQRRERDDGRHRPARVGERRADRPSAHRLPVSRDCDRERQRERRREPRGHRRPDSNAIVGIGTNASAPDTASEAKIVQ